MKNIGTLPILSIVIPTYNQGAFVERCLSSIQRQTLQNFEVIIQDSQSSDETSEICRRFADCDSRFQYYLEKDQGQSDAINRGLLRSKGKYWTWLCSDDSYDSCDALKLLVEVLDESRAADPRVAGAFGIAQRIDEDDQELGRYWQFTRNLNQSDFLNNWPLAQPSCIILKKLVEDVGGVNDELFLGMDLDLFLKILKNNRTFVFVDAPVVQVRFQRESKSVVYRAQTAQQALGVVLAHFNHTGSFYKSAYMTEYSNSQLVAFSARIRIFLIKFKAEWLLDGHYLTLRSVIQGQSRLWNQPKKIRGLIRLIAIILSLGLFRVLDSYFRLRLTLLLSLVPRQYLKSKKLVFQQLVH